MICTAAPVRQKGLMSDSLDPTLMNPQSPENVRAFRDALGCFATGVTVVTVPPDRDGALPIGVTVNSFNSVSLDPPLVLFSIDKASYSLPFFQKASHYVINVLADDQQALSGHFAAHGPERWSGIDVDVWDSGAPVLSGTVATFECEAGQQMDGGDHVIFIGRVSKMACHPAKSPLLYVRGHYARLAPE